MSEIDIDELLKILPKLIRENDTIKGAILSALSGIVATHEDIRRTHYPDGQTVRGPG